MERVVQTPRRAFLAGSWQEEQTPLTALALARLWEEAGGPPGTLQVLPAQDPVALSEVFLRDERIRKLTFTGSTVVGQQLFAQAAPTFKRVSLELGGHAPFLIFEDADLSNAMQYVFVMWDEVVEQVAREYPEVEVQLCTSVILAPSYNGQRRKVIHDILR